MPKPTKQTTANPLHNLTSAALVDEHGALGAEIAALEARRKAIAAELIRRGEEHVEGALYRTTIVEATTVATLDRKALDEALGDGINRFLKWSLRAASLRTAPRTDAVVMQRAA